MTLSFIQVLCQIMNNCLQGFFVLLCMNNLAKDNLFTAACYHSLYFVILNCLRSWTILGAFSQEAGKGAEVIAGLNDRKCAV